MLQEVISQGIYHTHKLLVSLVYLGLGPFVLNSTNLGGFYHPSDGTPNQKRIVIEPQQKKNTKTKEKVKKKDKKQKKRKFSKISI